jgi:hypothetical protein
MATIDTGAKAKTALEIARTKLLAAVPTVAGDYLAALDAQIG